MLPEGSAGAVSLLGRRVIPDGMPVVLGLDMRPVEPLSSWFRYLAYLGRDPETMRSYAYVVLRLAEFLAWRGLDVLTATETDLLAYRRQRLEVQVVPIDPVTTWDREASTVNGLFGWLAEAGHVRHKPLRMPKAYGSGLTQAMQVRHLVLEQYLFLRDVALAGTAFVLQAGEGRLAPGCRVRGQPPSPRAVQAHPRSRAFHAASHSVSSSFVQQVVFPSGKCSQGCTIASSFCLAR
ncbi:site-specific integrase [Streptomyces sp. NPDC057910]|uniref:site-specific integrase n=1 Tax=Streptomyces sp. NPDC057910 TaxID=3346278 RepID=UPI0036E4433A